jgi:hypothetical protein
MQFCEVCGKEISNAESLRHNMGPTCWAKHKAWRAEMGRIAREEVLGERPLEEVRTA